MTLIHSLIRLMKRQKRDMVFASSLILCFVLFLPKLIPSKLIYIFPGEKLIFHKEDEYGVFQVIRDHTTFLKVLNNGMRLISRLGQPDANFTQQMQGHLGMFYLDNPQKALVIGGGLWDHRRSAGSIFKPRIH